MPAYLFDTNAIQGIGRQVFLEAQQRGHRLLLSPISLWELVCHLDQSNFQLARGNARKAVLLEVLHDPLVEIMIDVACPAVVHPGRFDDQTGACAIIRQIEEVDSYGDLMDRQAMLGDNIQRIGNLAANMRNALDEDRQRYVSGMRTRCRQYIDRFGRQGAISLHGREFCEAALGLARTIREETARNRCDVTFNQLANRTLLGCGYGVARACNYIASVGEGQEFAIDGNDMEDYYICLHLGVSANRTLVTNDNGVRVAIDRTIAAFVDYANTSGTAFVNNIRVITIDRFKTETVEGS